MIKFRKKSNEYERDITIQYLRSLDAKAYKQFLVAIDRYREGDVELEKFAGKNLENKDGFME